MTRPGAYRQLQMVLPALHPGQQTMHDEVRARSPRRSFGVCGRGWGKTYELGYEGLESYLEGWDVLWGAPTFRQARIGWDYWTALLPAELVKLDRSNFVIYNRLKGNRWFFRGLEKHTFVRGLHPHTILLDEGPLIREEAYRDVLIPMIGVHDGVIHSRGTPNGHNWYYGEHMTKRSDRVSFQVPALGFEVREGRIFRKAHPMENRLYKWRTIVDMFFAPSTLEAKFRQEIGAEFVSGAGRPFEGFEDCIYDSHGHPIMAEWPKRPVIGHVYVAGVDVGKRNDYTVIAVFDMTTNELVCYSRFTGVTEEVKFERVKEVIDRYNPIRVSIGEDNLGIILADKLLAARVPVHMQQETNESRATAVEHLIYLIEKRLITLPDDADLKYEFDTFEAKKLPSGLVKYKNFSENGHDDIVDACLWGALPLTGIVARPILQQGNLVADERLWVGLAQTPDSVCVVGLAHSEGAYQIEAIGEWDGRYWQEITDWIAKLEREGRVISGIYGSAESMRFFRPHWLSSIPVAKVHQAPECREVVIEDAGSYTDDLRLGGYLTYAASIAEYPGAFRALRNPESSALAATAYAIRGHREQFT